MTTRVNFPQPTDDAEAALWKVYRETSSIASRDKLFELHAKFARNIARRHFHEQSRGDLDLHDLYQLAYVGLMGALDRFDPSYGAPFRSFAAHRISGSIRDGIGRMNEMREQISWRQRVRRERMRSLIEGGASDAQKPIDKLSELVVGLALGFMLEGTGMYVEEGCGHADINATSGTAYDTLAWKEMVERLGRHLQLLPERERTILQRHYTDGVNFDDLARLLRISKGRVSQLHHAALRQLKRRMAEQGHFRLGNTIG